MIGVDDRYVMAYRDQTVAPEMYRDIYAVTTITFADPEEASQTKTDSEASILPRRA
jgi:hypothetical protein